MRCGCILQKSLFEYRGFALRTLALFAVLALPACGERGQSSKSPGISLLTSASTAETSHLNGSTATWWQPGVGLTWQWQIDDMNVDTSIEADVYDVDMDVPQSTIDELHASGRKVICYVSVGSYEDWRADEAEFPQDILGNDYDGWPGERWLDIRQIDRLAPIMRARFDLCRQKGFDAIEPDNMAVDGDLTGFPLTSADELRYALWLAEEAHTRGLAIGQKNAFDQTQGLVDTYDFAIVEDCFAYHECEWVEPYVDAGKPVFAAEYTDMEIDFASACEAAGDLHLSMILKERGLTTWRQDCQ
jgi:hypothetical protein